MCCAVGVIYSILIYLCISSIDPKQDTLTKNLEKPEFSYLNPIKKNVFNMLSTAEKIQKGASTFLINEYFYLLIFIILFGFLILVIDKYIWYTVIAFVAGSITSMLCGLIGMYVATRTNYRVTYKAALCNNIPVNTLEENKEDEEKK